MTLNGLAYRSTFDSTASIRLRNTKAVDHIDREARSRLMANVKGKNTKPEMAVRSYLHARGLRYRLHDKSLPGKPDLVFKSRRTVVFVHGCFWHGHPGCKKATIPKTRSDFWRSKIETNSTRDKRHIDHIRSKGWQVLIIWQCEIDEKRLAQLFQRITEPER